MPVGDLLALLKRPHRHRLPADGGDDDLVAGEGVGHVAIGREECARLLGLHLDHEIDDLGELLLGEERADLGAGHGAAPHQQVAKGIVDHRHLALVFGPHDVEPRGRRRGDDRRVVHDRQRAPVPGMPICLPSYLTAFWLVNCGTRSPNA